MVEIQEELTRQDISYTNLPLYTLKIRAKLHEISFYFSLNYKGAVLATVLFATFRNGRQNKAFLTGYNVQTPKLDI